MGSIVGDDSLDLGMLVVRNKSASDKQELERLVSKERFFIVGKWRDHTLLQSTTSDAAGQLAMYAQEEEAEVITISSAKGGFVEEVVDGIEDFRGKPGPNEYSSCQRIFTLKVDTWNSDDVMKLAAVGVESLLLGMRLYVSESVEEVNCSSWEGGAGGEPGRAKKVMVGLGSVNFQLKNAPNHDESSSCVLVHQVEIEVKPTDSWSSGEHCFFVEAWPDASEGVNEVNVERGKSVNGEIAIGCDSIGLKVGATRSRAVAETVPFHGWQGYPNIGTKSATWSWAIHHLRNGRRFNPSKRISGSVSEFLEQVLPRSLNAKQKSVQLSPDDAKAVWTVNAAALNGSELPFTVHATLHTVVISRQSIKDGIFQLFGLGSGPGSPSKHLKVKHYAGDIIMKLAA